MTTPLDGLPTVASYAAVTSTPFVLFTGSVAYTELRPGVSTVSIALRGTTGVAYISTRTAASSRITSFDIPDGKLVTIPNVACPPGEKRYLSVLVSREGADAAMTVIHYPPAT